MLQTRKYIAPFFQVIYTTRNPKDASVSLFKFFGLTKITAVNPSFEEFIHYFTEQMGTFLLNALF